jgi:hypothetical protein
VGIVASVVNVTGLGFGALGAGVMVWGEMKQAVALLKFLPDFDGQRFPTKKYQERPWHQRFWIYVAMRHGPTDVMETESPGVADAFPGKAWGFSFLILGFVLQAVAGFL